MKEYDLIDYGLSAVTQKIDPPALFFFRGEVLLSWRKRWGHLIRFVICGHDIPVSLVFERRSMKNRRHLFQEGKYGS